MEPCSGAAERLRRGLRPAHLVELRQLALRARGQPLPLIPLLHRLRSEEHTSELQSRVDLVCRLLLEKKKNKKNTQKNQRIKKRSSDQRRSKHDYISSTL